MGTRLGMKGKSILSLGVQIAKERVLMPGKIEMGV